MSLRAKGADGGGSAAPAAWGAIGGTLSNQADLQAALDDKTTLAEAAAAAPVQSVAGKSGAVTLVKGDVGLGNVDNTADASKPISSATQTALDGKLATNGNGSSLTGLTKAQVGLGGADNTSDANKPVSSATQTALDAKQATSEKAQANGYASLGADGKVPAAQLPASGSDPWTYLRLTSDFATTSSVAVDITGLGFAPSANTRYEVEAVLRVRTATATVGPRPGIAWPTGCTDGVGEARVTSSATAEVQAKGNIGASFLTPVGGLPNTTQSWPALLKASFDAGAVPGGSFRAQLASETGGTTVSVRIGSWLKYRTVP